MTVFLVHCAEMREVVGAGIHICKGITTGSGEGKLEGLDPPPLTSCP